MHEDQQEGELELGQDVHHEGEAMKMPGKKEPRLLRGGVQIGDDILSQDIILVPSALVSLTSLFGMGRGGPHRNSHLKS